VRKIDGQKLNREAEVSVAREKSLRLMKKVAQQHDPTM
jgi:hypothetical protein